jgi:hypothetical protein
MTEKLHNLIVNFEDKKGKTAWNLWKQNHTKYVMHFNNFY